MRHSRRKTRRNNFRYLKQMKNKLYIIRGSIALLAIVASFFYVTQNKTSPMMCCNDQCFTLELAVTSTERNLGLMHRTSLPETAGMLFIFEQEEHHSFRMKNTLIPLDMIRINGDMQIVDIQEAIPCTADPCPSYTPINQSTYVLEINQWISKQQEIKIWDSCILHQ